MDLIETSAVLDGDLPVAEFRAHLRLGTGFADDTSGDALLLRYLRAAIAAIEARTGKALMARGFRLTLDRWRWADSQALPVAPVTAVGAVTLIDAAGAETVVAADRWRLVVDRHRPQILATGAVLPQVPTNGAVTVDFTAGFGATWDAVPDDLREAVLLLAAQYYEGRTGGDPIPGSIAALVARWMPVRVTAGGASLMGYALNRPMVLEQAGTVADGAGGYTTTWTALGTLWAEVRAGAGSERRGVIAPEGRMLFRVYLRAAPQGSPQRPRPDQRLREGERIFTILAVSEADTAGAYLVCHAREEVPA